MNNSAVRRALTTLKKQGILKEPTYVDKSVGFIITVDSDLIQPKKKVYIRKNKKK